jgi:arginine decarboxylase
VTDQRTGGPGPAPGTVGAALAAVPRQQPLSLTIQVTSGVGRGPTKLAAFDAALREAGVHNFNLLCLSSVIPPASEVVDLGGRPAAVEGAWGDKLYVVMASERVEEPGVEAWAGVGWVQQEGTSKGLFVEHEGRSESTVRWELEASLASMTAGRPERFGPVHSVVRGVRCQGEPVCALVVAVYQPEPWRGDDVIDLS